MQVRILPCNESLWGLSSVGRALVKVTPEMITTAQILERAIRQKYRESASVGEADASTASLREYLDAINRAMSADRTQLDAAVLPLKQEYSTDGVWFRWADSRPYEVRAALGGQGTSQSLPDRWFFGPDDNLELRFEAQPQRVWAIWYENRRIGESPDIEAPEDNPAASIQTAKFKALHLWETTR